MKQQRQGGCLCAPASARMNWKIRHSFLLAAWMGLALLVWAPARAQVTTGQIEGRVVDEQSEPLPGVLITARNPETGLERGITSDSEGRYILLGLPPGPYVVEARLTGFTAPSQL